MRWLGLFLLFACLPLQAVRAETVVPGPKVEVMAEGVYALSATPLKGAPDLSSHAGQAGLLILFQPDCPWCHAQFKRAQSFAASHPDIPVLAVSLRGGRRDLLDELRRARTKLPAYRSSPALIDALGNPEGTPRVFALSAEGEVMARARGLQEADELAVLLERAR